MYFKSLSFILALLLLQSCNQPLRVKASQSDDGLIEVILLHINDVYEIAPLEGGKVGGMARVETIRRQLLAENPNVLFVHAGDFLNPSLLGTLTYEGQKIRGRQMVEVLNAMELDLVTFGNHEFDLDEEDLQARIDESEFVWLATNLRQVKGELIQPFQPSAANSAAAVEDVFVWPVTDRDGTKAQIGIFGATLNSNPRTYVKYLDPYESAVAAANSLKTTTDLVLGLTHLEVVQDLKLAGQLPFVPLLMGGHDHDHMEERVGNTVVAKADANVKSIYIHRITLNTKTGSHLIRSEWMPITDQIEGDPAIRELVDKWKKIQDEKIQEVIPDPYEVVYTSQVPLDGRESSIRNGQTNLGTLIAQGMLESSRQGAVAAFFNGGAVRLDDQLAGEILAIDLFRALPFGGAIVDVRIKGDVLKKALFAGLQNKGTGGYLQWANIEYRETDQTWLIHGLAVRDDQFYQVVVSDFLLTGLEARLEFLTSDNPGVESVDAPNPDNPNDLRNDLRKAVAEYLKQR